MSVPYFSVALDFDGIFFTPQPTHQNESAYISLNPPCFSPDEDHNNPASASNFPATGQVL